ncbi:hypothetical protein J5N97_027310 [Dioscorea zingiberensis]|uniref:Uncharacterized protein n=1 Tax=Dioscorea zingiberensis TaxID=325984 RepID=A0A9D5C3V4_9LILI|nr:hypothetical protein J5N97_027310 [Dioscorea zingiberensis]
MGSEAPSWAEQWGAGGIGDGNEQNHENKVSNEKNNKMANVKAAASVGLGKAKVAATAGAQKVKSGTSLGIKWVKNQYQKKSSK